MADNRIVIDLNETDTQSFDEQNFIQADAKIKFDTLISKFVARQDNKKKDTKKQDNDCHKREEYKTTFQRVHNTILINGKRGMGKTSFILSIEKNLENNICSLGIIDPTLIETSEHVFLNIITQIKCKIDEMIRCRECDYLNTSEYKNWKESLKKLASGLSMLDGVGKNHLQDDMWDSPELILEKGLSNAKHGYTLEKDFHKFIDESLKFVKKDAFLLVLDDIDTSLDKGKEILEVLRKYLTSPKLIIVMLGDIELYSILARQLQWQKMDPHEVLYKYEFELDSDKKRYKNQIEHLEEQYLVKILKPENRIDLKNLFDLKENLDINSENNTLSIFVKDMLENAYLTKNSRYANYYEQTLLAQSTRSVLQILHSWEKNGLNNRKEFIDSIKHTFYTTLKKKLEPYNLLEIPKREQFLNLLSIYILREGISRDNHLKLTPEFSKDEDNISMLYINAMANFLLKPSDYLAYFIKIGYMSECFSDFSSIQIQKNVFHSERFEFNESLVNISESILQKLNIKSPNTLRIGDKYLGNMFIVSEEAEKLEIPLALVLEKMHYSQKNYYFISFFKLIASICDIQNSSIDDSVVNEITKWLRKTNEIQSIPIFVLANIWQRVCKTFLSIEERPENQNKNYKEMFQLYSVGFLNAVYIEIELYWNNKVDIRNVSTSIDSFYDKVKDNKYVVHKDQNGLEVYTLFDHFLACPFFKENSILISNLSHIVFETKSLSTKTEQKIIFSKLSTDEQKRIIGNIDSWETYAWQTIANELRYGKNIKYRDVKTDTLKKLLEEMKKVNK